MLDLEEEKSRFTLTANTPWLATILLALLAMPMFIPATAAAGSNDSYAFMLHDARPPVDALGKDTSAYKTQSSRYVLQTPVMAREWFDRIAPDQRTDGNAHYPIYRKSMGLLVRRYWADGRPSSQESGWHGPGFAIHYDSFVTDFNRAQGDRTIAGHHAEHYVLKAKYVSWAEGDPRKEHDEVKYDLWVLPDFPYSWSTVQAVSPDDRVSVALAEHLLDRGLVARVDKVRRRHVELNDGSKTAVQEFAQAAWISDLKPATANPVQLPVVSAETLDKLKAGGRQDPSATCTTILGGGTPAFVREALTDKQQPAFMQHARARCRQHMPHAARKATSKSSGSHECASNACFEKRFSGCKPASYTTDGQINGKVRYAILGSDKQGCRVRLTYLANPNPQWVDKPLEMVLDAGKSFKSQLKQAMQSCLANDVPGAYRCSGPLRGVAVPQ